MPARPPSPPLLCLVTDRLALAAATGFASDPLRALERQVAAAVEAGVDLVQVRERDLEAGALCDVVAACVRLAEGSATKVVVNDRLDVALAAGAAGVHLRGDSLDPCRARALAPEPFLVGRSVRSADEAASAREVDYLVLGTVFATPSKPGGEVAGPRRLAAAVRSTKVPVLAIGGVSEATLAEVAAAGAAGFAAIRLFFEAIQGGTAFRERVGKWRRTFDMHRPIS